jgi:hypothetical protein
MPTKSGIDELPQFCTDWIRSIDEYQCLSGQCTSQNWVYDGKFILLAISIARLLSFLSW